MDDQDLDQTLNLAAASGNAALASEALADGPADGLADEPADEPAPAQDPAAFYWALRRTLDRPPREAPAALH